MNSTDVLRDQRSKGLCGYGRCPQPSSETYCLAHKEIFKRNAKAWYLSNKEHARSRAKIERLRSYGLTLEHYDELLVIQDYRCICGTMFGITRLMRPCIDHDHACCSEGRGCCGKCIRGIICSRCNAILGLAEDNPHYLPQFLIDYLVAYAQM